MIIETTPYDVRRMIKLGEHVLTSIKKAIHGTETSKVVRFRLTAREWVALRSHTTFTESSFFYSMDAPGRPLTEDVLSLDGHHLIGTFLGVPILVEDGPMKDDLPPDGPDAD